MASPFFIGYLAKYKSLRSSQTFEAKLLSKIRSMCQDFNWEVRKEMCLNLVKVCKYLGDQVTEEFILPELAELLDDEENEVKVVAF